MRLSLFHNQYEWVIAKSHVKGGNPEDILISLGFLPQSVFLNYTKLDRVHIFSTYPENSEVLLAIVLVEASLRQSQLRKTVITAFVPPKPVLLIDTVCSGGKVQQRERDNVAGS